MVWKPSDGRVWMGVIAAGALLACGMTMITAARRPTPPLDPRLQQALDDLKATVPWHDRLAGSRLMRRILPAPWNPATRPSRGHLKALQKAMFLQDRAVEQFRGFGTNGWPALRVLLDLLDASNSEVRGHAAMSLAVIRATEHPDWAKLSGALRGRRLASRALHQLVERTFPGEPFADARPLILGLAGLGAVGPAADWARPEIVECIRAQEEPRVRAIAVSSLGRLTPDPTNGLPLLRTLLTNVSEWPEVSAAAAIALVPIAIRGGVVADDLGQALKDPRARVRIAAAEAGRQLGRPASESISVLIPLLRHPMRTVRIEALQTLARIGPEARDALEEIRTLASDPDPVVSLAARDAAQGVARSPNEATTASRKPK